ncbi:MAG: TetR/AcrR family transcriptional regulator [Hyphomicrobium sp.]
MQSSTKSKRRGRPRAFDGDEALASAGKTFAHKGYSAATLDDLSAAMGINRPSLYAAFGDKEALYRKSLEAYARRMESLFAAALEGEANFAKALRSLYRTALDAYVTDDGDVVGCMVVCTAVTEAVRNSDLRCSSKTILDEVDALVAARVRRAIADKQLAKGTDARALARLAVCMLHSLAIRSRAGTSRKILDQMAGDAVALIAGHR